MDLVAMANYSPWQKYGNLAQIASAVLALAALAGIYLQVQANLKLSTENAAREIYRGYLQMAVQHPGLAYPESAAAIAAMAREEKARYGWFVSYLLYTCEQILTSFPTDRGWWLTCKEQVSYHAHYICGFDKDDLEHYDPIMRELMQQVARASTADECRKT